MPVTVAVEVTSPVLQALEGTGTDTTQSLDGSIWQVSTRPVAFSSSSRASSM